MVMQKVNIGIVGGAGYTGGELLRVLLRHPNATISFVHSSSNAKNEPSGIVNDKSLTAVKSP